MSTSQDYSSRNNSWSGQSLVFAAVIICLFALVFGRGLSCSSNSQRASVIVTHASPPPLTVGAKGHWRDQNYRITAHVTVQIGEVARIYERHEYELQDDSSNTVVLVCGDRPGNGDWTLYTLMAPLLLPSPQESAAVKIGQQVDVGGVQAFITDLFQYKVLNRDTTEPSAWQPGEVQYGYAGTSQYNSLLVRWDQNSIQCYRGTKIPALRVKDFITAFTPH